ncbi:MAG: hypothetical protein ACHQD8_01095 [Chitinophagales bacterium]
MKRYFTILFILFSLTAWSQQDTTANNRLYTHTVYERHSIQATLSLGFIDAYRHDFTMPARFEKGNASGYTNIAIKLDYGLSRHISLAANFGYDAFVYNFNQLYQGYNGLIRRYKTNNVRIFNAGLVAYYHLSRLITVKNLDPFVGVGLSLNNLRYSEYPQGDSTLIKLDHTVTPYLKAGAHYYISDQFSLFGDVGYEKQSIFSLGFSCRFFSKER